MADKSMKAVIVAEVDPRGVAKGVAATNKELQKLNKTAASASTSAAISAGHTDTSQSGWRQYCRTTW